MMSLLPMCGRLRRRRNGVVALVTMALLPLQMRRRLAIVDDDGDGMTGDSIDDNCDSATNVNTDNSFGDNDGDDATGNDDDDDDDVDGNGAADDDINDDDCNGAMDGNYNDDGDDVMEGD
jgi:hypothetical protein